jgi:hypothetical protein
MGAGLAQPHVRNVSSALLRAKSQSRISATRGSRIAVAAASASASSTGEQEIGGRFWDVCFVPKADSCAAANYIGIRSSRL